MAKHPGRLILVKVEEPASTFTTIAGGRTKSMSINSEQVDVSDSESSGQFRELLEGAGIKSVSIALSGIFEDGAAFATAATAALDGTIKNYQFIFPDYGTFEGLFQIASLDLGGEYNAEANYAFSLESAGAVAFTAA